MAFEKDPNEIGVLWAKTGAKGDYMSGTIDGIGPVVVFRVKSASDRAPDWRVLKAKPRDTSQGHRPSEREPEARLPSERVADNDKHRWDSEW